MNRRKFAAMTAMSYSRVFGANERLGMALIGSGRRGRDVMKAFLETRRADLRCVADVYDVQRDRARAALGKPEHECVAHQEALARPGVDAVLIGTPDHLHLDIATDAFRARKHVYLEKPAIHGEAEGAKLLAAWKASGVICQVGTQQRSGDHYKRAKAEIFAKQRLGKVTHVRAVWSNFPWQSRKIAPQPKPAGLDWERFLGRAPKRPYDWARYDSWRYYRDYGGGVLADILNHWADVAQWMMDDASPIDASALGGIYEANPGRENPDTVSAIVQYRNWNLTFECTALPVRDDRPGVVFFGTEGTLDLARSSYVFTPHKGQVEEVKATGSLEVAHAADFMDAIKSNRTPTTPIATALEGLRPSFATRTAYWKKHT